jgi:hypothetical protein
MSRPLSDANRIKVNCVVGNKELCTAVWHVLAAICFRLVVNIGLFMAF